MENSLGSMLWTNSSRSSSLASFGNVTDERDFDRLSSVIPDSYPLNTFIPHKLAKFSAPKDEVSELALSEGFSWAVKEPPRPGQFSRQPHHQPAPPARLVSHSRQASIASQGITSKVATLGNRSQIQRGLAPLDLPELGLLGNGAPRKHLTANPVISSDSSNSKGSVSQDTSDGLGFPELLPRPSCDPLTLIEGKIVYSSDHMSSREDHLKSQGHRTGSSDDASLEPRAPTASRPGDLAGLSKSPPIPVHSDRQRLDSLKLPLPHGPHVLQAIHNDQPSSICGDLERPVAQTPKSSQRQSRGASDRKPSRPIRTPRQEEQTPKDRNRSQSRASNISKKRSHVEKHRSQANTERQKEAMHQMAENLNKCIRISVEERQVATWEIEKLQSEINQREVEKKKVHGLLSKKEDEIKDALARCQKLEDNEHQATDENQRLSGENEALKEQLSEVEKDAVKLKTKYRAYRGKLNDAIEEQQNLFTRCQEFYKEAKKELEREEKKRTADTCAIKIDIEDSRNKCKEMENCLEELRTQTEEEGRKKDALVSQLETKLKAQEVELSRERGSAIDLRQRIEDHGNIQEAVARVESQVQALLENRESSDANEQKQTEVTSQLSSKRLDHILEHLSSPTNNTVLPIAIESTIERLERKIISRILPAVLTVISGQAQAEESFVQLRDNLMDRLAQIQSGVDHEDERRSQHEKADGATSQDILDLLVRIDARTVSAEKTYKQTERQFVDWTHNEAHLRESFEISLRDQINQQLRVRESVLGEVEQKLYSVVDDYRNKIDAMKDLILESDDDAKKHLQDAIDAIRHTLENGFNEESARSHREIIQSEDIQASIEGHLEEINKRLAVLTSSDPSSETLHRGLNEEQQTVTKLRQKLAQLENEAKAGKEIHERWQQDINAIGMMRDQLRDMRQRVPEMKSLEAKFQNMAQINQVMDSTAKYLMTERSWVCQQLRAKTKSENPSVDATEKREKPEVNQPEIGIALSNAQSTVTNSQASLTKSDSATGTSSQDESMSRKVVVYSPREDANSPFPPPSIAQEQLRRREAAIPRSILRPASSSQDASQELPGVPPNNSQYNRPVTGKSSSATASTKQGVIDQIRFGLVQEIPTQKSWGLTTVADFERDTKSSGNGGGVEKKHMLAATEQIETTKRIKTERESSQTEMGLKGCQQRPKATKKSRVIRTYSRKPIIEE
ncbi:hypothetical protein AK830_g9170 [Neonectria ditissima]|uniref:Uncharacterized protein n=1 Tax=Neonectria ditissima TaxID=78410 RepID=A0A0P7BA33_9HYPO|nr:hypothetical protein AK830_g9170 [Neonectria ditissima]